MAIKNMWTWINETLTQFKAIIGDKRTFGWFVIIVIGLMIRTDSLGVTSIVRALALNGAVYPALLHFFRSERFNLNSIEWKWQRVVSELPHVYRIKGMAVMIGDGMKQTKEGRFMPGVKKLHQESENSAKGEYIFGHMFGGIGVLIADAALRKMYCVLISLRLHDGLAAILGWQKGENNIEESHVVKTIKAAGKAARSHFGPSLLLLDRLYLTVPMLKALDLQPLVKAITRAKKNCVAYRHPEPKTGRGARPKKGAKVKVAELFDTLKDSFVTEKATLYGKEKEISFTSVNLLWGAGWYRELKFVLVLIDGVQSILVSTDLSLTAVEIIEAYCYRFKIECAFRELKQVIAGHCYRFWSKYMPKLPRFKPNEYHQEQLSNIDNETARKCICKTVEAIERFALMSCIALGLLQIIGIKFSEKITGSKMRFLRTPSKSLPSEATVADFMRKTIYQLFRFYPGLAITTIIKNLQVDPDDNDFSQSA